MGLDKVEEELIDTLWNVNQKGNFGNIYALRELIDTLWNVNWKHPQLTIIFSLN